MNYRNAQKYLAAFFAVSVLLVASKAPESMLGVAREGNRYLLPGDPVPSMEFSAIFAASAPVRRVTDALVYPIEAVAERLRPYARLIFPSLWEDPRIAPRPAPYTVRDTALRLVRESL